ncbi:hypothetical protein ACFP65_11825 [Marinilactibacillus sp. GCM10026970]|uniref:hypothetical protein n=1 Tax=Marinilactibacillus sp. GCM10026970 TaxID=3252642 RepID=UPI003614A9BB
MKINWNKQSIFLLGLLTIVLGLLFYFGNQSVIEAAKQSYESSNRILNDQQMLLNDVNEIEGSEDTLLEELESLNAVIPSHADPSQWMESIKNAADSSQLTIESLNSIEDSIESEATEANGMIVTIPYQLTVRYENLNQLSVFIDAIYQLTQKTDITAISYEQEEGKEASLMLTTYTQSSNLE